MKICIVTEADNADRRKDYIEVAKRYFDTVLGVPMSSLRVEAGEGAARVYYKNTDISSFDVVFFRAYSESLAFAEVILDVLESNGVYLPNSIDGLQITCHKYHSVLRASRIGVPVPDSSLSLSPETAARYSETFKFPLILKLLRGFGGKGVMMVKSEDELKPILDTISVFDEFLSAQRFIPNEGTDVRAYVIGDEVIGIRRRSGGSEWRANVTAGGSAEIIELDEDMREMALRISELLGLEVVGIDFMEGDEGPVFIEANFTAGYMPTMFGTDLLDKIMAYLYQQALEQSPHAEE